MPSEGDLEAAEEVALAEETAAFGHKRRAQLEDRPPRSRRDCRRCSQEHLRPDRDHALQVGNRAVVGEHDLACLAQGALGYLQMPGVLHGQAAGERTGVDYSRDDDRGPALDLQRQVEDRLILRAVWNAEFGQSARRRRWGGPARDRSRRCPAPLAPHKGRAAAGGRRPPSRHE